MMRSLFSAVSGLRNHQTMMDTVGNNIANVNTVAFKSARVTFQDLISQTMRQASTAPNANVGGTNPVQVGLGVQLGSIDTLMAQGNLQASGRPTDLAIQGDGWFVLSDGNTTPTLSFTRDGNFDLSVPGTAGGPRTLVHSATGLAVQGYTSGVPVTADTATQGPIQIPQTQNSVAVTGFNIASNGVISLTLADGTSVANFAQVALAKFPNDGGLQRVGGNLFQPTANSGTATYNGATANGRGELKSGFLEMSNVDLATQFTNMIIAQRGFQSNTRVITATDEILQDLVNLKR